MLPIRTGGVRGEEGEGGNDGGRGTVMAPPVSAETTGGMAAAEAAEAAGAGALLPA